MSRWFALWDSRSNNLVSEHATLADSYATVRDVLEQSGEVFVSALILTEESDDDAPVVLAMGAELAEIARHRPPVFAGVAEDATISGGTMNGQDRSDMTASGDHD
jgi:hypothetical protein